jgi:hypothetical protein
MIPTRSQLIRAERALAFLRTRGIKCDVGGVFAPDPERFALRSESDVARRAAVLWTVVGIADGLPRSEARESLDHQGLFADATQIEKAYLVQEPCRPEVVERWRWRGEALFTLLWALGRVEKLGWPETRRDRDELGQLIGTSGDARELLDSPAIRPSNEILDAAELFLRLHRFARDEMSCGRALPKGMSFEVIRERHLTLNWLINSKGQDWDDVTPS